MFQQAIDYFIQNVLRKKPVKVLITQQQITNNGQVNRLDSTISLSFTNVGRQTAFVNNIPLNQGGFLTVLLNEGETDITDYNVRFATTLPSNNNLVLVVFKQIQQ